MDKTRDAKETMRVVIESWREDPEFRARVGEDPKKVLESKGLSLPVDAVRVAVDTPDIRHFVFPPDPNTGISDERLSAVAGGLCHGCYVPPATSGSGPIEAVAGERARRRLQAPGEAPGPVATLRRPRAPGRQPQSPQ